MALKWVLKEEGTKEALALWDRWQEASERVIAPPIFRSEVTNALHQMVRRGHVSPYDATDLLRSLVSVVAVEEPPHLYVRALGLAGEFALGSTYDALYLALAESEGCEVWTADLRLCRAVDDRFSRLRCLGRSPAIRTTEDASG